MNIWPVNDFDDIVIVLINIKKDSKKVDYTNNICVIQKDTLLLIWRLTI